MDQRFQTGLSTNADWPSLRDAQGCKCPKKQTPSHGSWGMMRIWHPTLCACSHAQSCMYNYTITTVPVSSVLYMTSFISCRPRRKKTNLGREIRVLPVLRPLCNDFKPWFYVPPCPPNLNDTKSRQPHPPNETWACPDEINGYRAVTLE